MISVVTGLMCRGLGAAAARFGDRPGVLAQDEVWTFADLDRAADAVAHHLASRGVGRGDRVALMTSNRPEFVACVHGTVTAGATAVLLNPSWKAHEVGHALRLTTPRYGIADGAGVGLLAEETGSERVLDLDAPGAAGAVGPGARVPAPSAAPADDDDAVLVFSSGTTGLPKAVRHTHRSLARATAQWCGALGLGPSDRFQVATPPSHILGLLNLLAAAAAGATVRLHRRFDLDEELRRIEQERMTLEMVVAPIALAMAGHPSLESYDLSSLRFMMWGATPVTEAVARTVTARTGVRWLPAYGTSEVPVIAANPVGDPGAWRLDTAGLPVDGVTVRVADLDTGQVLGTGAIGELQVKSTAAMAGYLPAEATADAFADGWYRTGDVGRVDPGGWVHITDRCKEMIKVRGFQVAPAEIEAVLLAHPDVADCAVFGVPDPGAGEAPVAAVVLRPGARTGPGELSALVASALAPYKRLRRVDVVDRVPRTPSGKVLRRLLQEARASAGAGAVAG